MTIEDKNMKLALKEAKKASLIDEVPIGCVIVKNNRIIARGYNKRETTNDPTAHAEIVAIRKASKKLSNWRLEGCDLYVTIEPCIMCAGAIIQSRIAHVYYGAPDPKGGALGSSIDVLSADKINHHPDITGGVLSEECSKIIKEYFQKKRKKDDE
ncbi:MAG TPA: tRNA adenosine(34) deaminase TadA [Bacilli bacterium]|nr:tRNA adenosine(34) deaminase TadA [Bacilli bacterium]HPS18526.1 tRNA adenosine(34) deaminase TadA [Bacilli bacterium]